MERGKMAVCGVISKKIRFAFFCVITGIILVGFVNDFHHTSKFSFEYLGKGPRDKTEEIVSGVTVTQEIPYTAGCMGISFMISNSGREISGDVMVRATGKTSGFIYVDQIVSEEDYRYSEYVDFYFPKDLPSEDETIVVNFTSDCESGIAPMLLTTHEDSIPAHSLFFDGEEMQMDLMARKIVHRKSYAATMVVNTLKMVLSILAVYLLLLGSIWESPAFINWLRKISDFSKSAPGIIIYTLIAALIWIRFEDLGPYPAEVCAVRFVLISILTALILQFNLIHRLINAIKCNKRQSLKTAASVIIAVIISFGLTLMLKRVGILSGFSRGKTIIILFCLVSLFVVFTGYLFNRISANIMITLTVFLMGSVYAISYPVATKVSWDDYIHYKRILEFSLMDKSRLSAADLTIINKTFENGAPGLLENGKSGEFTREMNQLYGTKEMVSNQGGKMSIGLMLPYLPQMIGLSISRAFGFPFSVIFILGKWFGVLFYSCLIFLAVKQLRSGKIIIMAISLCPLMVFQSSNYTYDTWVTGLSILAFARFIGIMQDRNRKIKIFDILGICLLFIMGFSAKQVYCPLLLSLLFVKRDKLDKNFSMILYYAIVVFSFVFLAASFIVPFLTANADSVRMGDIRGGSDVDSGKQLAFIFSEPLEYTKILLRSLWQYWSVGNLSVGLAYLGWLGPADHQLPVFFFMLIIVLLDKSQEDVYIATALRRGWTLLLAFGTSAIIGTSMYLSFTPVRSGSIAGFQDRYVVPILFFVGYFISDYRLVRPIRKYISEKTLLSLCSLVLVSYSTYAIYLRCLCLY